MWLLFKAFVTSAGELPLRNTSELSIGIEWLSKRPSSAPPSSHPAKMRWIPTSHHFRREVGYPWWCFNTQQGSCSEDIRQVCSRKYVYGIHVILKLVQSLHSVRSKVKDHLPTKKQSKVAYRIPCSFGKAYIYIEVTRRRLKTRLREHRDACQRGTLEKLVVAEHVWKDHQQQIGGDHSKWQSQMSWRTATQGGHPHPHDPCWGTP